MGEFYPIHRVSRNLWDVKTGLFSPTIFVRDVAISPAARGLYHCRGLRRGSVPIPAGSTRDQVRQSYRFKIRVNGTAIANDTGRGTLPTRSFPRGIIFFKDQSFLLIDSFTITSMTLGEQFNGKQQ